MRFFIALLIFCRSAVAADFDSILIGSSPFSLFEALYRSYLGERVLILEEADQCGGAWKSVDVCGVRHADLGCHQIGQDPQLKTFLEEYAGCQIVSMDHPLDRFEPSSSPTGFYFSQGCFELVDHLLKLIEKTDIVVLTGRKVESASIDPQKNQAVVKTNTGSFTAKKLVATPMSGFSLQTAAAPKPANLSKSKYFHLYLLIEDPSPPRFSYQNGSIAGISRIMNLTHFVGLTHTGRQLLVFQTHNENQLSNGLQFLEGLKNQNLVDRSAYILKEEPLIYETSHFNSAEIQQINAGKWLEVLSTGHFQNLVSYISKWKQVFKPYSEVFGSP